MFRHLFRLLWKKLGCSKLDENDLDDSVFEIEDEELSDEEIIVDVWALAE